MRALLVPVKAFRVAKHRLEPVLDAAGRAELARRLGSVVLRSRGSLPAYVACDDGEVADWAAREGAQVLWTPGLGLSGAVGAGVAHLHRLGVDLVLVAHADLPLVESFERFGRDGAVTLAPDWRRDGTNVAAVPSGAGFTFSYGPGSFRRHSDEARRLGLPLEIVDDERFARDLDLPDDLPLARALEEASTSDPVRARPQ